MNNKNDFSVAMCVYGGDNPEHFRSALESIINQTVAPSEVVLVVDGPVPTAIDEIVNEYEKFDFFKVIRFSENQGHGNARRAGLSACSNEYVALMDADDISLPDRFERQLEIISKGGIDIVGGDISEFVENAGNIVDYRRVPTDDANIKSYMKHRCPFNQMTVMFRKSIYETAGGYIDWYCNEDYYLWIRMYLSGAVFANTGTVLVNVRTSNDMYRRRGGFKYFISEAKIQKLMLNNSIIGIPRFVVNVGKRFIVQCCLPNKVRGWAFKKFARTN